MPRSAPKRASRMPVCGQFQAKVASPWRVASSFSLGDEFLPAREGACKDLVKADLVIADLTDITGTSCLNLMFAWHSKTRCSHQARGTGPIFDADGTLRVKEYDPSIWPSTISVDVPALAAHFKAAWDKRDSDTTYMALAGKSKT